MTVLVLVALVGPAADCVTVHDASAWPPTMRSRSSWDSSIRISISTPLFQRDAGTDTPREDVKLDYGAQMQVRKRRTYDGWFKLRVLTIAYLRRSGTTPSQLCVRHKQKSPRQVGDAEKEQRMNRHPP